MLMGIGRNVALSFAPVLWVVRETRQFVTLGLFFVAVHGFRMPLYWSYFKITASRL